MQAGSNRDASDSEYSTKLNHKNNPYNHLNNNVQLLSSNDQVNLQHRKISSQKSPGQRDSGITSKFKIKKDNPSIQVRDGESGSIGKPIKQRFFIAKQYMKWKLELDIITTVAFLSQLWEDAWFFHLFFLLRIIQIEYIIEDFNQQWQLQTKYPTLWTLLRLLFILYFTAHVMACVFHAIGSYELSHKNDGWILTQDIQDMTHQIRYLFSIYFIVITMISVGYGDISPTTNNERIAIILITIISSGVFALTVNMIGQIFQERILRESKSKKEKYIITDYMKKRGISKKLQVEIRKYLDYLQSKLYDSPAHGQNILNKVSIKLQQQISIEFYGKIIKKMKMFGPYFSQQCLDTICLKMREVTYGPGEIIYNQNEKDHRLYYVYKGEVQQYIDRQSTEHQHSDIFLADTNIPGDVIGIDGFFGNDSREYGAKCKVVSHLIYIEKQDVLQALKNFPVDHQIFCQIRDEIIYSKKNFHKRCLGDGLKTHTILNCNIMHYIPNKQIQIMKINKTEPIKERKKLIRKNFTIKDKRLNTLKKNQYYRQCLIQLRRDFVNDLKDIDDSSDSDASHATQKFIKEKDDKRFYYFTPSIRFNNLNEMYITDSYSGYDDSSFEFEENLWDSDELGLNTDYNQQSESDLLLSDKPQDRQLFNRNKSTNNNLDQIKKNSKILAHNMLSEIQRKQSILFNNPNHRPSILKIKNQPSSNNLMNSIQRKKQSMQQLQNYGQNNILQEEDKFDKEKQKSKKNIKRRQTSDEFGKQSLKNNLQFQEKILLNNRNSENLNNNNNLNIYQNNNNNQNSNLLQVNGQNIGKRISYVEKRKLSRIFNPEQQEFIQQQVINKNQNDSINHIEEEGSNSSNNVIGLCQSKDEIINKNQDTSINQDIEQEKQKKKQQIKQQLQIQRAQSKKYSKFRITSINNISDNIKETNWEQEKDQTSNSEQFPLMPYDMQSENNLHCIDNMSPQNSNSGQIKQEKVFNNIQKQLEQNENLLKPRNQQLQQSSNPNQLGTILDNSFQNKKRISNMLKNIYNQLDQQKQYLENRNSFNKTPKNRISGNELKVDQQQQYQQNQQFNTKYHEFYEKWVEDYNLFKYNFEQFKEFANYYSYGNYKIVVQKCNAANLKKTQIVLKNNINKKKKSSSSNIPQKNSSNIKSGFNIKKIISPSLQLKSTKDKKNKNNVNSPKKTRSNFVIENKEQSQSNTQKPQIYTKQQTTSIKTLTQQDQSENPINSQNLPSLIFNKNKSNFQSYSELNSNNVSLNPLKQNNNSNYINDIDKLNNMSPKKVSINSYTQKNQFSFKKYNIDNTNINSDNLDQKNPNNENNYDQNSSRSMANLSVQQSDRNELLQNKSQIQQKRQSSKLSKKTLDIDNDSSSLDTITNI